MNEGISESMSMTVRTFLTSIALLCGLGLFACSWPWPSIDIDNSELGKSAIDQIIRSECCVGAEERIARKTVEALAKARNAHSQRAAAESIGFICDEPPSRICRYTGSQKYRVANFQKDHPLVGKVKIVTYFVVLPDYEQPNTIDVQQNETVVTSQTIGDANG